MSSSEASTSDSSFRPEDNGNASESENYSSAESDLLEEQSDVESLISVGGGWSRVDVFEDRRPDPLPPLVQALMDWRWNKYIWNHTPEQAVKEKQKRILSMLLFSFLLYQAVRKNQGRDAEYVVTRPIREQDIAASAARNHLAFVALNISSNGTRMVVVVHPPPTRYGLVNKNKKSEKKSEKSKK